MKKRRFGLKLRFIGLIVILLTTIFAIIAFVLIQSNTASLRQDLLGRSKAFAALATKPIGDTYLTYQDSGTVQIDRQITTFTQLDNTISNVFVVDSSGKVHYSLNDGAKSLGASDAASFVPVYKYDATHSIKQIIYPFIEDDGSHQYAVVYNVSSTEVTRAVQSLERSIVMYSLIGLIISALVTYLLINQLFLIPIKQLRDRAIVISGGHYSEQIAVDRNDESGDLAQSVRQMAERLKGDILKLQEVDKVKTEFMMIASHNLRTPLTIIDGYVEMAKSQTITPELRKMLDNIDGNSKRLGVFAEDLLIISSLEAGQKIFTMEQIDIDKLTSTIAKDFKVMADSKQIQFTANVAPTGVQIQGSTVHLRSAIYNLLDNALKFTAEQGQIEFDLTHIADTLQIVIKDTGAGIAPEEISKLFTKFHRGTSTLNYNYEGTGIGLYLTKLIITEHGGTIAVQSELGKGSTFTITLPAQKAAPATVPAGSSA
jgi:signal transduction histidine kinase